MLPNLHFFIPVAVQTSCIVTVAEVSMTVFWSWRMSSRDILYKTSANHPFKSILQIHSFIYFMLALSWQVYNENVMLQGLKKINKMYYSLLSPVKTLACLAGTRLGGHNIQTGQLAGHEKLAHTECLLTTEDLNCITHSSLRTAARSFPPGRF